jgi:hypothetical protein
MDLDALHSMRDDAPTNKDPAKGAAYRARAYEIVSYATTSDFIPPPANLKEVFTDDEEGGMKKPEKATPRLRKRVRNLLPVPQSQLLLPQKHKPL